MRMAKTSVIVLFRIDASAIFMDAAGSGVIRLHSPHPHSLRQEPNASGHDFIVRSKSSAPHAHRITAHAKHFDLDAADLHGRGIQFPENALPLTSRNRPHRHLKDAFLDGLRGEPTDRPQQHGAGHARKDVLVFGRVEVEGDPEGPSGRRGLRT